MNKKTGYLLGMLVTIVVCMILAWIFCCGANVSGTSVENEVVSNTDRKKSDRNTVDTTAATSMPFSISERNGTAIYETNSNFNFNVSEFDILLPLDKEVTTGIRTLKEYIVDPGNEHKMLNVTGYYDEGEQNTSAFANLGLARANAVKNYFVNEGIASKHINTYGERNTSLSPDGGIYRGPVAYKLIELAQEDEESAMSEMTKIADAIKADPLVLYFNTAEASVSLSEAQRLKLGDMSRYLDKVDGATIIIAGHTDSEGSNTTNDRLGLERADFAREYLKNNGIPGSKIKTITKGKREPIASNGTEEGRAKNRRAVVTIN